MRQAVVGDKVAVDTYGTLKGHRVVRDTGMGEMMRKYVALVETLMRYSSLGE